MGGRTSGRTAIRHTFACGAARNNPHQKTPMKKETRRVKRMIEPESGFAVWTPGSGFAFDTVSHAKRIAQARHVGACAAAGILTSWTAETRRGVRCFAVTLSLRPNKGRPAGKPRRRGPRPDPLQLVVPGTEPPE